MLRTISRTACQTYLADVLSHGEPVVILRYDVPTHVIIPIEDLPLSLRRRYGLLPVKPAARVKRTPRSSDAALAAHLERKRPKP